MIKKQPVLDGQPYTKEEIRKTLCVLYLGMASGLSLALTGFISSSFAEDPYSFLLQLLGVIGITLLLSGFRLVTAEFETVRADDCAEVLNWVNNSAVIRSYIEKLNIEKRELLYIEYWFLEKAYQHEVRERKKNELYNITHA